jgi:hypothetical protein
MRLRRNATLILVWAYVWASLRVVEIFASLFNSEEDLARFVTKFCPLLTEAVIQVHVFPCLLSIFL